MVLGVVDRVHTDSVDAELFELLNVARAARGIGDWVLVGGRATRLVIYTANVEAVALGRVESCVFINKLSLEHINGLIYSPLPLTATGGVLELEMVSALFSTTGPAKAVEKMPAAATNEAFIMNFMKGDFIGERKISRRCRGKSCPLSLKENERV
jgi:hypothetical protein